MPKIYRVRFYSDIERCDDTKPCEVHARAYPSQMEAEKAANGAMALIRGRFGVAAGYLVADRDGETVAVGPIAPSP